MTDEERNGLPEEEKETLDSLRAERDALIAERDALRAELAGKEKKEKKPSRVRRFFAVIGRFFHRVGQTRVMQATYGFFKRLARYPILQSLFFAALLFLVIDILGHRSVIGGILHLFMYPHLFMLNTLIIWLFFLPGIFFKRRYFVYMAFGALWLTLGIVNFVLLSMRVTPFEAVDIAIFKTGFAIIHMYMTPIEIALAAAAIIGAIIVLVIMWFKVPRAVPQRKQGAIAFPAAILALAIIVPLFRATGIVPTHFHNLRDSYEKYGFVYSFSCSLFDRGISKPDEYDKEAMQELMNGYKDLTDEAGGKKPNIIFLQLESFFDLTDLESVSFSEDPMPFFNSLKESCYHGYLTVPSIGAGTANTEFESITGMSLSFFGTGEYPYKTVLQDTACEAMPHVLRERGYTSTAIHNHTGTFYDRHTVYSQLGFNRYIAREYMQGLEDDYYWNQIGWVRDEILTREIMDTLHTTPETDYVYAVSVQGHGGYPSYDLGGGFGIEVTNAEEIGSSRAYKFQYFANQMRDMDNFIKGLTEALDAYDENVVLVMYGDHLPSLEIEEDEFKEGTVSSLFQTEYIIWSNFGLEDGTPKESLRRDLAAYQTAAYTLDLIGIHAGNLLRYHQTSDYKLIEEDAAYKDGLHMLQYDILYGKQYVYEGMEPYEKTDMQMGLHPITIDRVESEWNGFTVEGDGFTIYSVVLLNGSSVDFSLEPGGQLIHVTDETLEDGDVIMVIQEATDMTELSSVEYVYSAPATE